ncbi:MAG TPA: methyl-accepting chemotaxis protein, partial [Gammaproteobacteria bacterium]|nr:methyl-accepting chemotaxis protein [Gammaproteobacteria bacterium]HRW35988.1 methyl-accepting chemotaxis protein [Thermotogota bacterium]
MLNKLKLIWRIIFLIGVPVAVTFIITIIIAITSMMSAEKENAFEFSRYLASNYANEIKAELEVAMDAARTVAQIFEGYEQLETDERRSDYNNMLKSVLEKNEKFLGAWTCWEKDAIDGLDAKHKNSPGHDNTGRFVPYWYKINGSVQLEPLADYDQSGAGDYYLIAQRTGKEVITDPYLYDVGGKTVLMTSLAVPIKNNGKVVGVAGIDIDMGDIQSLVEQIKPYQTGLAALFTSSGVIASHFDSSRMAKNGKETEHDMAGDNLSDMFKAIENGKEFSFNNYSEEMNSDIYIYINPFKIGNAQETWSLVISVPMSKVLENANRLMWLFTIICIIAVSIIIVVIFLIGKSITNPIGACEQMINKIKEKDLASNKEQKVFKYTTRQDEVGNIVNALIRMEKEYAETIAVFKTSVEELNGSAENLSAVSQEQLASSEELTAQAEKIDTNVQNTSASIEEVTSGVEEVASSAQNVSSTAQELSNQNEVTAEKAHEGGKLITNIVKQIEEAVNQTIDTAKLVQELAVGAKKVEEILVSISSIAEQTNLLALNAAIEAARAGEAGKGFAVVADEIRKLAEESKKSTDNISNILKTITSGVNKADSATDKTVEIVNKVNENAKEVEGQFTQILKMVEETTNMIESLTAISEEQGASAQEMAGAMDTSAKSVNEISDEAADMSQSVVQQTKGAQQVSSAAEQLSALA